MPTRREILQSAGMFIAGFAVSGKFPCRSTCKTAARGTAFIDALFNPWHWVFP